MKTSTNPTTIKNAKHYFKTARKISTAICAICILLSVLFLMSSCCCCPTVADGLKEDVEKYLAQEYDEVGSTSELEVHEISDGMWSVTGPIYVYRYNFGTQVKEAFICDVDFRFKEENSSYTMVSQNIKETEAPSKNGSLPSAISKVNKKNALKVAEETLKSGLNNPDSYKRHDYTIGASYKDNGDILVTVIIDFSAENIYGGMVRHNFNCYITYDESSNYSDYDITYYAIH